MRNNEDFRALAISRTWKHLFSGAFVGAVGTGLGVFIMEQSNNLAGLGLSCAGVSWGGAGAVAYNDWFFPGDYTQVQQNPEPTAQSLEVIEEE